MKKIIFIFLWLLILTGCFVNEKEFQISAIILSPEERAVNITVDIDHDSLDVSVHDVIEYGIIIIDQKIKDASELNLETSNSHVLPSTVTNDNFICIITDIENYINNFSVRGYLKTNEEIIYTEKFEVFNLYDLAKADDGEFAKEIKTVVEMEMIAAVDITYDGDQLQSLSDSYQAVILDNNNLTIKITPNTGYYFSQDAVLFVNGLEVEKYTTIYNEIIYSINNNDYVNVSVSFTLDGGQWTKNTLKEMIPENSFTATFNDDFKLVDQNSTNYKDFYKLFLKYEPALDLYKIVSADNGKVAINELDLIFDYVLVINENYNDKSALELIKTYTSTSTSIGKYILLDEDTISFYSNDSINQDWQTSFYVETVLPTPYREDYIFIGWNDGKSISNVFPRYKANENIYNITYTATWEPFSFDHFIPDTITSDLNLPEKLNVYPISWSSSHPEIISNDGKYIKPYQPTTVVLTASIEYPYGVEMKTFEVFAKGYKQLGTGIASGYIYRNYNQLNDDFFDTLDIINCAFIHAYANGNLSGAIYLNNVKELIIPKAHARGDWVIMSIAPESDWSKIASDQNTVEIFADNIVNIINEYGFDGVDIDWETPTDSEKTNFTKMMKVIYEKVKANNPHHLVTAAVGGGKWQPPCYDLENSAQYIDYINMMTYGMVSENGYYQNALYKSSTFDNSEYGVGKTLTSCSIEESIEIYNSFNIPNNKIIVGAAFYGMKQLKQNDSWKKAGSIYYTSIVNLYNNDNYILYYDENAGVPYLLKNDGSEFISFDNERSIKEKCDYILDNELGGIMYWENGCDLTGNLLRAIKTGLDK